MGALGGGLGGSAAAKIVADTVADDDSKHLLAVLQEEIQTLAFEYMLMEDEVEYIASEVKRRANPKWLRYMFKASNKATDDDSLRKLVRIEFEPQFEAIIRKRPRITLPPVDQFEEEALKLVETLAATDQDDR